MKKIVLFSTVAMLVLSASLAFAQGGGGRQGGGRGFNRGGGNGFYLLMNPSVQTEIKLTNDQKTKIQEIMQKNMGAFGGGGRGRGNGGNGGNGQQRDRDAIQKAMEETEKTINATLSSDQKKRLKEINLQQQGNRAILDPEVQKQLGMSDQQKKKAAELQDKQRSANRALRDKAEGGGDRQKLFESMRKNGEALEVELGKVLDKDQAAKLKAMGGKPFKLEMPEGGFGGRGGRGAGAAGPQRNRTDN